MTLRLVLAGVLALGVGCRCASPPPAGGPPTAEAVDAMPDPYRGLPPRGGVPPSVRARQVLENAGRALGYGKTPVDSLDAHAGESWVRLQILFLDHGGLESLRAAWIDLSSVVLDAPGVPMGIKANVRRSQARLDDLKVEEPPESILVRRYVAEIAWTLTEIAPGPRDGGRQR